MTRPTPLRLLLVAIPAAALCGQTVQSVDICTLFRDPARWNGVMIRVQGAIVSGAGEGGPWLSGEQCSGQIEVKGEKFPNIIELADPRNNVGLHAVNFQRDEAARDKFILLLEKIYGKREHLRATVIGLFETRTPLDDLIHERPHYFNGFGDQGGAPAQILVKTMIDMAVEHSDQHYVTHWVPLRVQQRLWLDIKRTLTDPGGPEYFESSMRDTLVPDGALGLHALSGTLISSEPPEQPSVLILGMLNRVTPEATLKLAGGLNTAIPLGTRIEFEGVAVSFTQDPFMVTFEVPLTKVTILK
jgi:hypothetical protein